MRFCARNVRNQYDKYYEIEKLIYHVTVQCHFPFPLQVCITQSMIGCSLPSFETISCIYDISTVIYPTVISTCLTSYDSYYTTYVIIV